MKLQKFNWPLWAGFLLTFAAAVSYPLLFVRWPLTRDFPWATIVLFGVASVLLVIGIRRAFATGRSRLAKAVSSILATLSVVIMGLFLFSILVMARWLPASTAAPQLGQKAPDFSLADTSGQTTALAELLTTPIEWQQASIKPKGVLLIFYRGYW